MTSSLVKSRLRATVDGMAVGRGDLRERLVHAWSTFHVLKPEDFPAPSDRETFERLYRDLTTIPGAAPGAVDSCVAAMSWERVEETARALVELANSAAQD